MSSKMKAAEVLLAHEPLQQLHHENFLLREENRRVRSEVQELLCWKEKAIAHMTSMAPARRRAAGESKRAKQAQLQLRTVESSLKSRRALDKAVTELKTERGALQQRVETLKRENTALKVQCERRKHRAKEAETQLAAMGDSFRLHLERLVAMREKLDDVHDGEKDKGANEETKIIQDAKKDTERGRDSQELMPQDEKVKVISLSSSSSDLVPVSSAALVTGLDAVAIKCFLWLQDHLAHSFAQHQLKAGRYEAQHAEIKQLKEQVHAARLIPKQLAEENARQNRELTELRVTHEQLQQRVADAELRIVLQRQRRADVASRLRLVVSEVRQYLRLVRGEIKRKFGYLPEAIAHAESWARIAEAVELLLCQCSDRCIAQSGQSFDDELEGS